MIWSELGALALLLLALAAIVVGVIAWIATGIGAWANLSWIAVPSLAVLVLAGALVGRIKTRTSVASDEARNPTTS